jgi:hypothetical protein
VNEVPQTSAAPQSGEHPPVGADADSRAVHLAAVLLVGAVGRVAKYSSLVVLQEMRAARAASGRIVQYLVGATLFLVTAWFVLNAAIIWIGIAHLEIDATVMLLGIGGLNLLMAIILGLIALRQWRVVVNTPNRVALKVFSR